jgi:hypothetical protein
MTIDSVPELARRVRHLETLVKRGKPADGSDNASLLKRISALESSVARIGKAAPTKPQVYTPKPAVRVPKPTDNSLALKLAALEREVERLRVKESGKFIALTTQLTSTSWDGDSFSTTAKTKIDLSAVFGVPAGVKAVLVKVALRDSGSAAASCVFQLSGISSGTKYSLTAQASPINDRYAYFNGIVPCDANGDVYYQINASGSATMDVYLEIWGYWL